MRHGVIIIPPENRRRPLSESVLVTHAKHKRWGGGGSVSVSAFIVVILLTLEKHKQRVPPRFNYSTALSLINRQAGRRDLFVCVNVRDSIKTLMTLFQAQRSGRRIVTFDTDTPLQMKL